MASGSGKNQQDSETKGSVDLLREREESNAAAAAAAPPPLAPQSEIKEVDGPPEAGDRDRDPSAASRPFAPQSEIEEVDRAPEPPAATAAAAERKGEKETKSLFRRRGSAGGKPPLPPRRSPVSRARGPSSVAGKAPLPPPPPPSQISYEEVMACGDAVRDKWRSNRENRIDMKDVFDQLMLDCQGETSGETDEKAEAEGMPRQQNEQVLFPFLDISTSFLSDSSLLVIWPLGDRILPLLGILGEDLGYWSLELRNCMDILEYGWDPPADLLGAISLSGLLRVATILQRLLQEKSLEVWSKKDKKPLWIKFLDRIGKPYRSDTIPHVKKKKLHITEAIRHYSLLEMVAGRGVEFHSHALNLRRAYSEFRPVHGDGECFYRSFIFSYLEQVLDRQDTHEEHRLLAAVEGVARQHVRLGWPSEFSRSHKAFKKLIKKVMRWKTHRLWKHVPTTNSYRIKKLLEFFNDKRTDDSQFVAAIWICSHSEEFVPLIPELNEAGYTLTEWCFQEVIQRKVFTDHVQMTALVRALRVPLRVEYIFQEAGHDLYNGQDPQDDMPRSTCWPRHHHQVPPDHEVPRVTVLYAEEHYDILYPYHPDGPVTSGESFGQRSDKLESEAAKSPSQYQIGSSSGEASSQQVDRVEGSTSPGEKSNKHTAEGGS